MMRIVFHYAFVIGAPKNTVICVDATQPQGSNSNTLAYTLNDKIIRVLVKKWTFQ